MINHPTIEEIMNNEIEVSLPFGKSDGSVKETEPEDMSKEDLITAYKHMSENLTFLNEDSERHEKCKLIALKIVIYSSRLNQLGAIVNTDENNDDIEYKTSISTLHESILEELKELKKSNCNFTSAGCDVTADGVFNTSAKLLNDLIYEFENLDYSKSYELGNQTLQIFGRALVYEYL